MMMNSRALRLTEEELHTMRSLHEREFSELSTNEKLEYIEELLEEEKRTSRLGRVTAPRL